MPGHKKPSVSFLVNPILQINGPNVIAVIVASGIRIKENGRVLVKETVWVWVWGLNFSPTNQLFNDDYVISGKEAGSQEYTGFRTYIIRFKSL